MTGEENSSGAQVQYHRDQARAATIGMLASFALAFLLLGWRLVVATERASISMEPEEIARKYEGVLAATADLDRVNSRLGDLNAGVADRMTQRQGIPRFGARSDWDFVVGIRNLDCMNRDRRLVVLPSEKAKAAGALELGDQALVGEYCREHVYLIDTVTDLSRVLKQIDAGSCPADLATRFARAERVTGPSPMETFDPSKATLTGEGGGVARCGVDTEYLRTYVEGEDSADYRLEAVAAWIRDEIRNGSDQLELVKAQLQEQAKNAQAKADQLKRELDEGRTARESWLDRVAGNFMELAINVVLTALALLAANAGYRLNRAHNFEIVSIRRREAAMQSVREFLSDKLPIDVAITPLVLDVATLNPFAVDGRVSDSRMAPGRRVADTLESIKAATSSLADSASHLREVAMAGKPASTR